MQGESRENRKNETINWKKKEKEKTNNRNKVEIKKIEKNKSKRGTV